MKLTINNKQMQNIKIEVKVSLPSGASVGLTDTQNNQISTFISGLLFGEAPKEKRAYNRKKKYRTWTKEEDELLIPVLTMNEKETRKYYKQIKRQLNRNMDSIYSRVYVLRKNKSVIRATTW